MPADPRAAPVISVMLAVSDASAAARWYAQALGATTLWDLGGVVGMTVEGAPFFLGEPEHNGWDTPATAGTRTVRIEVPWGTHRQGGFLDPFGHKWLVGDRSPLARHEPG
jgi:PhnB protein